MNSKDMKAISAYKTHGKVVTKVFDADRGWKEYASKSKIPGSGFLMNYDLRFGHQVILLLDNYGNDYMPADVEDRLIGKDFRGQWLLGIDRATGEIFRFVFYTVKGNLIAVFSRFESNPKVPKKYLKLLDNLKSCKRPWDCLWKHSSWLAFWNRDMAWDDFISTMVIRLELFRTKSSRSPRKFLEIWGDSSRVVSGWV
jgi:hypothetical protein